MSQVTLIFCAIIFLFSACKSRDDAQLASEDVGTEVFTLKGHRVFRFLCVVGEEAPKCKDWDFQELDELLESHPDYASYKIVAPALRDIESATKDIANVKAAMEKETRPFQKKGMQARIDVQETAILKLQEVVKANPKGEALYLLVDALREKFPRDLGGIGEFRGQDWSRWFSASGFHTCALSAAGAPICWGSNNFDKSDGHKSKVKPEMLPLQSISAGYDHTCALTRKGEPLCWGQNNYDKMDGHKDKIKPEMLPLKMLSSGGERTCALTHKGGLICWGAIGEEDKVTSEMLPFKTIRAGGHHTCALTRLGDPICWGNSRYGRRNIDGYKDKVKPEMLPLKMISAGNEHTCALSQKGEPICWGENKYGRTEGHTMVVTASMLPLTAISSGDNHTCALSHKGEPICWGSNETAGYKDKVKPEMIPLKVIVSGAGHSCALTSFGKPICWGSNDFGEITGRSPEGYKLGLNVPEDVDLSFEAFYYGDN